MNKHILKIHGGTRLSQGALRGTQLVKREMEIRKECLPICRSLSPALKEIDRAQAGETSYRSALAKAEESGLFSDETRQKLQLAEELLPLTRKETKNAQVVEDLADTEDESDTEDEVGVKGIGGALDETRQRLQLGASLETQIEELKKREKQLENAGQ
ncbi:MAG: hypothetical protein OXC07_01870 [Kistimonas sp.]|nr:hypothetical protein [Kistimonas sp.]